MDLLRSSDKTLILQLFSCRVKVLNIGRLLNIYWNQEQVNLGLKDRVFECETCKKTFKTKGEVRFHQKIKNYKKSTSVKWKKTFPTKYTFKNHFNIIHSEKKIFECLYCDSKFKTKSKKIQHEKLKHSIKRHFKCTGCGFRTKYKDVFQNLKMHSYSCKIQGKRQQSIKSL